MKNKKWLTYTLGTLLTLIVLALVAGAGFRFGMMQNVSFTRPAFAHKFDGGPQTMMQENPRDNNGPQAMQGNRHNQGFDNRKNDGRGGMHFFSPIFGLIHLLVLGLLIWGVYKLIQNSGWRLTRVSASPTPAPSGNETPSVAADDKKEEV